MPLKGLMIDGYETLKTKSADMAKSVADYAKGLRAAPVTGPAMGGVADPLAGSAANADAVLRPKLPVPYDPVRGQAFTPGDPGKTFTTSGDPTMAEGSTPRTKADTLSQRGATGPSSPLRQPRPLSPEAQAYQNSRAAAPAAPTQVPPNPKQAAPRFQGLRSLAKGSLAGAAAYGGVSAAVDAFQHGNTDQDYAMADKIANAFGADDPKYDAIKHATSPIRASIVGAGRRFFNAVNPFGGSTAQAAPTQAPAAPSTPVTQAPMEDLVDVTDGGKATPEALIGHTGILPVEGQGAFKRTTPGNVGPAYKVGTRSNVVNTGTPQTGGASGLRLPKATTLAGHMVNLTALGAQAHASRARETGAAVETSLGIKAATANAGIAKTRSDLRKAASDNIDREVTNEVSRRIDPRMPKEEREAMSTKQKGELSARISHSLANRGVDVAEAKPQQLRQLMLADRIRDKITTNWDKLPQQFRDYIGNKRIESDDLFHYIPEVVGKEVHFGGNRLPLDKIMGGTFNFFGPNDPVNRDMMELIQEAQKRAKGK